MRRQLSLFSYAEHYHVAPSCRYVQLLIDDVCDFMKSLNRKYFGAKKYDRFDGIDRESLTFA